MSTMILSIRRFAVQFPIVLTVLAALLVPPVPAQGQTPNSPPNPKSPANASNEEASYIAVVKGTDVYVRCGAAESYYPFAKVNDGDLVKVIGEKYDWMRIVTAGPAFRSGFGYIKSTKGDTSRFRLAADGKTGVTLGKTDIVAPNLDAKSSPKDSWKSIVRLEADQTLRVIKVEDTEKDTIVTVALPDAAQGWISKAYLERAGDAQTSQWNAMLAQKNPDEPTGKTSAHGSVAKANSDDQGKPRPVRQPATPKQTEKPNAAKPLDEASGANSGEMDPATGETTTTAGASSQMGPDIDSKPATTTAKPSEPRMPTFDDLEAAFKLLQKEPVETAEVGPLREMYLDLASRSGGDQRIAHRAGGRAEQLQIWADIQKKRGELDAARTRAKMSAAETDAVRKALESSADYTAVGRVATSTIYDGKRLPKLLRLQDPATGRTVAYLQPDEQYELINLIGNLVGIVGDKNYDESMRLNIIAPHRIDILTAESREAAVKTEP